jgi:pyrroloquinoline quinone biosynthesis protein B
MGRLTAIVLGSAAGGGFPQWNCRCAVCSLAWAGDPRVRPRTQTSLAVSADGERWVLINAAPDLAAQIHRTAALHPRAAPRGSPITAVVLTGGEIDQTAGLLSLRERQPFALYATPAVLAALAANPMFGALSSDLVRRQVMAAGNTLDLGGGLAAEAFVMPGKAPLYLESDPPLIGRETAQTVGVELRAAGARLVFVPAAAALPAATKERLGRADVLLFDGTLFRDDEMIRNGTGEKTGRRMGHMSIDGPDGSLAALAGLANRRLYIHINNTNPILVDGSAERACVAAAGWEVAEDGMEVVL